MESPPPPARPVRRQADSFARFRAGVAFVAATGIVLVCLSYRNLEPTHSAPRIKNGNFFASLAPSEDTIDSPDGTRGFQLLQKVAASSLLQHMHKKSAGARSHGSQELAADGLEFRTQDKQVDFLSANAARNQMQLYWQNLARQTKRENGGLQSTTKVHPRSELARHEKGPLTAEEARRQLSSFWSDLGKHDRTKTVRRDSRRVEAATRLLKKAKKAHASDVVKDTSMDEMERIWSSESKSSKKKTANAEHRPHSETVGTTDKKRRIRHQKAAETAIAVPKIKSGETGEGDAGSDVKDASLHSDGSAVRYTSLPMCDHCSLQHFRWPVWNHRVDHALRVAENIAQGSHWIN